MGGLDRPTSGTFTRRAAARRASDHDLADTWLQRREHDLSDLQPVPSMTVETTSPAMSWREAEIEDRRAARVICWRWSGWIIEHARAPACVGGEQRRCGARALANPTGPHPRRRANRQPRLGGRRAC